MLFGWALKPGSTLVIDLDGLKHAAFGRIPWESIVGLHYSEFRFSFRGRVDAPFAEGWEPGMDSRVLAGLLAGQAAAPDASTYQTV
jgi:hypothetical protein